MRNLINGIAVPIFKRLKSNHSLRILLQLTFVIFLSSQSNLYAQKIPIKIYGNNISIKDVIQQIENQSEYRFFYSDNYQALNKRITININSDDITEILNKVLKDSKITFEILENNGIALTPESRYFIVSGVVKDANTDEPLPGVNISIKGTTKGYITNVDGEYSIEIERDSAILVFSYVGFIDEEKTVNSSTILNISLFQDIESLEEIVVVGYGIQKKVNVTGAVSFIKSEELTNRPVSNSANLLQGRLSGVQITQSTGQPGMEDTEIRIRGCGSYATSNDPLVLIDGVVGELGYVNPQDIESISVLKDAASASIYGARAANGVILVTTKSGKKDSMTITYGNNFGWTEATKLPDLITSSVEYMEMWNKAADRSGNSFSFTDAQIKAYEEGQYTDPDQYPNYDWVHNTFKSGFTQNHNISINGGSDKFTFNTSFSYVNQDGILPGHYYTRYTTHMNMTGQITDRIQIGTNVMLTQRDVHEPSFSNDAYVLMVFGQSPLAKPYLPDGSGRYTARAYSGLWQNRNPVAVANEWYQTYKYFDVRPQASLKVDFLDNLTWNTKGAINYEPVYYRKRTYALETYYYHQFDDEGDYKYANDQWPNDEGLTVEDDHTLLYTLYSTLQYNKVYGEHSFSILGGYSQENQYYEILSAYREDFTTNTLTQLDAGSEDLQENGGSVEEWALQSLFGRINYSFKEKYLFEANCRMDGSSRFSVGNRWGIFPSFSGAWRFSKEDFLNNFWLDNGKLRVSYGELGNQDVDAYPYQRVLETTSYAFGSSVSQGVVVNTLTDQNIKWETTKMLDAGLDFSIRRGLLSLEVDAYRKITDDILYQPEIPASVGLEAAYTNYGKMQNLGIDLQLGHRYTLGDLTWEVTGIYSMYRNKVLKIENEQIDDDAPLLTREGLPWQSYYLYEFEGVFQSEDEIETHAEQSYSPQTGDMKIKDQNGDGEINEDDRIVVRGAHPDFTYSFNSRFEWKGFDLTMFFQGVKGVKHYVNNWGADAFTQGGPPPVKWRNAWSEDNPSDMPALCVPGYSAYSSWESTFHLADASYFRLKSVNLGYTIPQSIMEKAKIKYLRIYVAGDNLLTITGYEGLDPERIGNTNFAQYPQVRVISAGMDVRF